MKFLNNLWRLVRSRRDALLAEVKQIAREEAERVFIDLITEFQQKVEELAVSATLPALPADRARPSDARSTSDEPKLGGA